MADVKPKLPITIELLTGEILTIRECPWHQFERAYEHYGLAMVTGFTNEVDPRPNLTNSEAAYHTKLFFEYCGIDESKFNQLTHSQIQELAFGYIEEDTEGKLTNRLQPGKLIKLNMIIDIASVMQEAVKKKEKKDSLISLTRSDPLPSLFQKLKTMVALKFKR